MKCQFEIIERKKTPSMPGWVWYRCMACGFTDDSPPPPHWIDRDCSHTGAGDWLAWTLSRFGITERRWIAFKKRLAKRLGKPEPKGCRCPANRDAMNWWTWRLVSHSRRLFCAACRNRLGWRLTQLWRREHRLFTVAIVGTTVVTWLTKWLFF